ncbi:MAG: addiction module protein [Gemmatimonadaceae bacterium]
MRSWISHPKTRLQLVEKIWDSLAVSAASIPVPGWHQAELDRVHFASGHRHRRGLHLVRRTARRSRHRFPE